MAKVGVMKLKVPPWRIGNLPAGQVNKFRVRGQWSKSNKVKWTETNGAFDLFNELFVFLLNGHLLLSTNKSLPWFIDFTIRITSS